MRYAIAVVSVIGGAGLAPAVAQEACDCDCIYEEAVKSVEVIPLEAERNRLIEWRFNAFSGIIDAPGISSYGKQCGLSYKTYIDRKGQPQKP